MEILIDEEAWCEARQSVTRYLLGGQVWAFTELFDALDDPKRSSVSWRNPFLQLRRPMPADWNNEDGPTGDDSAAPQRDLFVALTVLTAGVAVQELDPQSSRLVRPRSVERYLSLFSPDEVRRCVKRWLSTGPEWITYGDEMSRDGRNSTLRGRGPKGTFSAALSFAVSPRILELSGSSAFHIRVGLPYSKSKALPPPDRWTHDERWALRDTTLRFLRGLREQGRRSSEDEFGGVRIDIPANDGSRSIESFEASVVSADQTHYLSKVAIKPFGETVWARFPRYSLGIEGPTLPITNGRGELVTFFGSTVMATMLFPAQPQQRTAFLAQEHLRRLDEVSQELEKEGLDAAQVEEKLRPATAYVTLEHGFFSLELIRALRSGPSTGGIQRTLTDSLLPGLLVGQMLLVMIQCGRHHREHVGVLKAVHLASKGATSEIFRVSFGSRMGETKLREAWSLYKSVAHLWAALQLGLDERSDSGKSESLLIELDVEFLAKAEELRRLGEECFARGQRIKRGPVLDPAETWRAPRDLALPRVELVTAPLPECCLDLLAGYKVVKKAPRRRSS